MLPAELPVGHQLVAMQSGPFENQRLSPARQAATHDPQGFDLDLGLEFGVLSMKVGRHMLTKVGVLVTRETSSAEDPQTERPLRRFPPGFRWSVGGCRARDDLHFQISAKRSRGAG